MIFLHKYLAEQTIRAIITGKKIKTLSLAVQCNAGRMLCWSSLLLGGRFQSLGFCSHSGRTALSESSSYHVLVAELYCSNLGGQGLDYFFFCLLLHFWDGLEGSEDNAHCHRAWATMCTVTWAPWSPENGMSLLPSKFSCQSKSPSVKPSHIVPTCLLEEPLLSPRGHRGSTRIIALAQERSIIPRFSLCFITFPPALMGTTKWRAKRQDAEESKQDHVALFRCSPSGSS